MATMVAQLQTLKVKPNELTSDDSIVNTPLTPREQEVLELLAQGLGSKYAARELNISYWTIRTHQRNIYRKLGARTLCHALNQYRSL